MPKKNILKANRALLFFIFFVHSNFLLIVVDLWKEGIGDKKSRSKIVLYQKNDNLNDEEFTLKR